MKRKYHISLIIVMLSISLFCCYHIYYYLLDTSNDTLIRDYYVADQVNDVEQEEVVSKLVSKKEDYLGIISIPKINLKTGFYNKNSKKNNVSNSVTLLKESILPGVESSIIYLAAHSGSGYLAYFKNINKLTYEDIIDISINKVNYQYSIFDIYELPKNGSIMVNRNINENYLVLTTCSNNKNMQLVIVSKMINKV